MLSFTHVLLLILIGLIFFGPDRLPKMGQSIGKAVREFKNALSEVEAEVRPVPQAAPAPAQLQASEAPTPQQAAPVMEKKITT